MREWGISSWGLDLNAALRAFRRHLWAGLGIILSLGVGIGVNVTVFALIYAVLLRPLPYQGNESLVAVQEVEKRSAGNRLRGLSDAEFVRLRDQAKVLEELVLVKTAQSQAFSCRGRADSVVGRPVSAGFFSILRERLAKGRDFVGSDESPGSPVALILSYEYWMSEWGGSLEVGSPAEIEGQPAVIIGVAPPGFQFLFSQTEIWISARPSRDSRIHQGLVIGRLEPDLPAQPAAEQLASMLDFGTASHRFDSTLEISSLQAYFRDLHFSAGRVLPRIYLLGAFVLLLLFLATANAGGIFLARAFSRQQEMKIRHWLGAGRWRLAAGIWVECFLCSVAASGVGLLLSNWIIRGMLQSVPLDLERFQVALDWPVLAFTGILTLMTGALLGLVPATAVTRRDTFHPASEAGPPSRLLRLSLVVQIAFCVAIFIGASLLLNTMWRLWQLDPGFDPEHLLVAELKLPEGRYVLEDKEGQKQISPRQATFVSEMLEAVKLLPGVSYAAATYNLFEEGAITYKLLGEKSDGGLPWAMAYRPVTREYFDALGMTIIKGRNFDAVRHTSPRSVVISRSAARRLWHDGEPAGLLSIDGMGEGIAWQIVGVVSDTRQVEISKRPLPSVYVPYDQQPFDYGLGRTRLSLSVVVRTSGNPSSLAAPIREAVRRLDPLQPITRISPMRDVIQNQLAEREFYLAVAGGLSALAIVLVIIGLVGVLNIQVASRRREYGIRMTVGASPRQIANGVIRTTLLNGAAGSLAGVLTALVLTRTLEKQLYGVSAYDPASFAAGAVFVVGSLLVISLGPALEAAGVDSAALLRSE